MSQKTKKYPICEAWCKGCLCRGIAEKMYPDKPCNETYGCPYYVPKKIGKCPTCGADRYG